MKTSIEFIQTSIEGSQGNIRKMMSTEGSHKQSENSLMMGKMFPEMHPGNLHINPYSAKGLGDRLYAILHKMPGEVGY